MDIVVVGPKGGETKMALDDGKGLCTELVDKTFVKGWKNHSREKRQNFKETEKAYYIFALAI